MPTHSPSWRRALAALDANAERWLLLVFYSIIVVTIMLEVVRRFVFSYSSIWGEEVARYAFIYLSWIGAARAVRDRCHIRIDFLVTRFSERTQGLLCLLSDFATLVLALIALYASLGPIVTSLQYGSVTHGLRLSLAWFLAAVPLAFALTVWRIVQSVQRDVRALLEGRPIVTSTPLFEDN